MVGHADTKKDQISRCAKKMKRKRRQPPNANIWNTLICPFVNDLKTLLCLRQTCSQLRYVTSPALAACIPIGKYSFAQYTNVCGNYQSSCPLFVHYHSLERDCPPQIRDNLLEWDQKRKQIPQGKWTETDVRCRIRPEHNFHATEHIYWVFAQTMSSLAHNQIHICYKSNLVLHDHVMMYVLSDRRCVYVNEPLPPAAILNINEQFPHSHVIVKCYQRGLEDVYTFGMQLLNNEKLTWKLTIAYHDDKMTCNVLMLRTNATEIVFQNWHLDMDADKLHMPNAVVITLDYRCNHGNTIHFDKRLIDDLFQLCPSLQKIILLSNVNIDCKDTRVEVHLQSSFPLVTVEGEYR